MSAPSRFVTPMLPAARVSRRRRRGRWPRRLWRAAQSRVKVERRDLLALVLLLALVALLVTTRFSDRFFEAFAGKPPNPAASSVPPELAP